MERCIEAASWSSETPEHVKAKLERELLSDPEDSTLRLLYTTPESLQMERLRWVLDGCRVLVGAGGCWMLGPMGVHDDGCRWVME